MEGIFAEDKEDFWDPNMMAQNPFCLLPSRKNIVYAGDKWYKVMGCAIGPAADHYGRRM